MKNTKDNRGEKKMRAGQVTEAGKLVLGYGIIRHTGDGTKENPFIQYCWTGRRWERYGFHPCGKTWRTYGGAVRAIQKNVGIGFYSNIEVYRSEV